MISHSQPTEIGEPVNAGWIMRCINRKTFLLSLGHGPLNYGPSIEMALT